MRTSDGLNGEQLKLLGGLVGIPSWSDRENPRLNETAIMQYIEEQLQNCGCRIWRMPAPGLDDPHGYNLVVEKGTGSFNLFLTGHVDTVPPDPDSGLPLPKLQIDGDRLHGLGVWDMKAGIMAIIDVMRRIDPPPGMKVTAIFLRNEELESDGAIAAINDERLPKPDLVFSPEIPTLVYPNDLLPDKVPVTIGRRGHVKTEGVLRSPGGHGSEISIDAPHEFVALAHEFTVRFRRWLNQGEPLPLLDQDEFRVKSFNTPQNNHHSGSRRVDFLFSQMTTMSSVHETLQAQYACMQELEREFAFARKKLELTFGLAKNKTSYAPYIIPPTSKAANAVIHAVNAVHRHSGPILTGGSSTSDANIFARAYLLNKKKTDENHGTGTSSLELIVPPESGWPIYESSAAGKGAHKEIEETSAASVTKNIRVIEELVSGRALDPPLSSHAV